MKEGRRWGSWTSSKAGAEEVKVGAKETTARARDSVHEAQVRRDLVQAYTELGRTTYTLVDEGSLRDERVDHGVTRIRELGAQLSDSDHRPSELSVSRLRSLG